MTGGGFGGSAVALVPDDDLDAVIADGRHGLRRARLPPPGLPPRRALRRRRPLLTAGATP